MHITGHWEAMNEMDGATPFLRQKDGDRSSPAHLGLREWFAAVVGGWVFSLLHPPTHHCSQNSVDIRYSHCIQRQGCTWLHRYCISNVLIIPHGCAKQKTSACFVCTTQLKQVCEKQLTSVESVSVLPFKTLCFQCGNKKLISASQQVNHNKMCRHMHNNASHYAQLHHCATLQRKRAYI